MRLAGPVRTFLAAWAALLVLLACSVGGAWLPIGAAGHAALPLGIAATQAAILLLLFMKLRGAPQLKWLVAGAGFFWLALLLGLSRADYFTRTGWPH